MERPIRLLQRLNAEPNAQRLATLFRVKSIDTGMHRHSENLLILVGHQSSSGSNQPVALASVISGRSFRIEECQRSS